MNQKVNRFFGIIVLIAFTVILSGCRIESPKKMASNPDTWQQVTKSKKIVIGLDDSFVPMGFQTKKGSIVGYDVDLAKAVFKQYGIKVDFQPIDWSMNVTELRNGTIDLIWNGFSMTPEREKSVLFSKPYLVNDQILVTKKSQNISSFADMKGKVAGVQAGSAGAMDIDNQPKVLKNRIKDHSPVLYDSFTDAFIDLNSNRIQGLLIDSIYADYYIAHQANEGSYQTIPSEFPKEKYAVGMRKGDTKLKQKIDEGLTKLAKNGQLKKIDQKWFGNKVSSPLVNEVNK
ncbi:amino acid ABC transporter substrate-binding protein [Lentilactobacillus sp. Marseille-Q4993]|uniref:amino acid ABC transporter substrate-binding protein n=1 Tax=Lentilactobacillus sp. Marseille-Q4993 TaxID=3039492 RepID=UPI0024BC2B97|nr:amino acid ABC transporter substrate-binding protein [Lentilactobacillus sp. Marseille-Q4993]